MGATMPDFSNNLSYLRLAAHASNFPNGEGGKPLHGRSFGSIAIRRLTDRPGSHPRKT